MTTEIDFGTDLAVDATGDLDIRFELVSDLRCLGEDLRRRFSTSHGRLFYALGEGYDLRTLLHRKLSQRDILREQIKIANEAQQDERVYRAGVRIELNSASRRMTVRIAIETLEGPFTLVLGVDQVTVEILELVETVA